MAFMFWLAVLAALGLASGPAAAHRCAAAGDAAPPRAPSSCLLEKQKRLNTVQQVVENGTMTFGVFGLAPAVLTLLKEPKNDSVESYGFRLTLGAQRKDMSIEELPPRPSRPGRSLPAPAAIAREHSNLKIWNLTADSGRYFWVNVSRMAVSLGRLGEAEPLLAYSVQGEARDDDDEPWIARFSGNPHWVHSCSSKKLIPTLACRKGYATHRTDFRQSFPIEDEEVPLAALANSTTKAVRFMVQGPLTATVRLDGKPRSPTAASGPRYYEILIVPGDRIAIRIGSEHNKTEEHARKDCCLSLRSELRLFTVTYNETHLEVFEGAELDVPRVCRVSTKIEPFKFESLGFGSFNFGNMNYWLHACQGEEALLRETVQLGADAILPSQESARV